MSRYGAMALWCLAMALWLAGLGPILTLWGLYSVFSAVPLRRERVRVRETGGDGDKGHGGSNEAHGKAYVRVLAGLGDLAAMALALHVLVFLALANVDVTDHTSRYVLSRFSPQVASGACGVCMPLSPLSAPQNACYLCVLRLAVYVRWCLSTGLFVLRHHRCRSPAPLCLQCAALLAVLLLGVPGGAHCAAGARGAIFIPQHRLYAAMQIPNLAAMRRWRPSALAIGTPSGAPACVVGSLGGG